GALVAGFGFSHRFGEVLHHVRQRAHKACFQFFETNRIFALHLGSINACQIVAVARVVLVGARFRGGGVRDNALHSGGELRCRCDNNVGVLGFQLRMGTGGIGTHYRVAVLSEHRQNQIAKSRIGIKYQDLFRHIRWIAPGARNKKEVLAAVSSLVLYPASYTIYPSRDYVLTGSYTPITTAAVKAFSFSVPRKPKFDHIARVSRLLP